MAIDKDAQRARWRRNQRARRARAPREEGKLCPDFTRLVLEERDRRAENIAGLPLRYRDHTYLYGDRRERALALTVDVWAAEVLCEARWGAGRATPTRIQRQLVAMGRMHGYTAASLRKMIYRALERVRFLETTPIRWNADDVCWPKWTIMQGSEVQ